MKRVGDLYERIVGFDNLLLAQRRAARGKRGCTSVASFEFYLEQALFDLQDELKAGRYRPGEFFTFEVHDPKRRAICAAPFRDRVVHHALCRVLEPHFERRAIADSYACRLGKGTHAAIARAQQFARRYPYFLKCDVRKFFANVDHGLLLGLLGRLFNERPLLELLACIIRHAPPDCVPGKGLPIGNLTSQHFANLYLGELDHFVKDKLRIKGYLRYMDDFLLFADDKPSLHLWLAELRGFMETRLKLALKEDATVLAPVNEGVPFLGFRVFPGLVRLNQRGRRRFFRKVAGLEKAYAAGMLPEDDLSGRVASFYAHLAQADTLCLRRKLARVSIVPG